MKKKVDSRIQTLVENGIKSNQRTMLLLVGDRSRYQIVNLHFMMSRNLMKEKPKVLWCYKNQLEFSSNQKKRMKGIKNMQAKGLYDEKVDDPFDLFVSSTQIKYTFYKQSHKILGNTFQMLVLQDFEALTPNLLCRAVQTVEGGGLIILLLKTMTSLKQLHSLAMDVHQRYRTDAFSDIQPRFNERFLLSLSKNTNCIVMDDQLNILPISEHINEIKPIEQKVMVNWKAQEELKALQKSLQSKQIIGKMIAKAKTLDQAKVIMTLVDVLNQKSQKATVSLTAGRGRGKSASLGFSLAAAINLGYSNIFVTAPSPQNLKTLFEFICIGLELLDYKDRTDFQKVFSSHKQYENAIMRIDVFKNYNQFIQFVFPNDADKIGHTDLIVIDQAAAIPLPYVKAFLGSYTVFMSSTINGYEGTGRSLSLKLIQQIRTKSFKDNASSSSYKKFKQITMTDPIRYALNDGIQKWLNDLLLLNATEPVPLKGQRLPHPNECELYIVNRDSLFSYKSNSQKFLFSLMSLFISSHYKNSPNDLQLISDSPSHLVFVLIGPIKKNSQGKTQMPDILCAIQLALQGNISKQTINTNSQRGIKPSGDLIPWNIRQQFQDNEFPKLAGGRIVRIATHAKAVKMGYGTRALQQLSDFFENKLMTIEEDVEIFDYDFRGEGIKKPLLKKLEEVRPPKLHYLGTSFGFTQNLLKFWRKNGYEPVYLRQTVNDITSEHSGIMIRPLENQDNKLNIEHYMSDFKRRFSHLLGFEFRKINVSLALQILYQNKKRFEVEQINEEPKIDRKILQFWIDLSDFNRLKSYSRNQIDYHLILDLIPTLSKLFFQGLLGHINMGYINQAILLGIGLQMKSIEQICKELKDLQVRNALPLFQKTIIKLNKVVQSIYEKQVVQKMPDMISSKQNLAVSSDKVRTKKYGQEQASKIFNLSNDKTKVNYQLGEDDVENIGSSINQGQVITIKRNLEDARQIARPFKKKSKK